MPQHENLPDKPNNEAGEPDPVDLEYEKLIREMENAGNGEDSEISEEMREMFREVVGEDKQHLFDDWDEAGIIALTLRLMTSEGILNDKMTLPQIIQAMRERQRELLNKIKDVTVTKKKIDPGNEL